MKTGKITDWAARMAGAKTAAAELREFDQALRQEHAALLKERQQTIGRLQPRAAILANMERVVDALAAAWEKDNAVSLVQVLGPGLEEKDDGTLKERPARLPEWFHGGPHSAGDLHLYRLTGAFPALAKARYAEIINAAEYEEGLPLSERPGRVAELDERIREIEVRHSQLVDEAATWDPPVGLQLLPAVAQRRVDDEAERKRHAEADAARAAAEAAVNAQEPAPRVGPSAYLAGQAARRAGQTG